MSKRKNPLPLLITLGIFLAAMATYRSVHLRLIAPPQPAATTRPNPVLPTPVPQQHTVMTESRTLVLGAFTLSLPAGQYFASTYEGPVAVVRSGAADTANQECVRVKNIDSLLAYEYKEGRDIGLSPTTDWTAWNTATLEPLQAGVEKPLQRKQAALKRLLAQPDGELSLEEDFNFHMSELLGCGGSWFFPTYKQTIPHDRFGDVTYLEVNSGNGIPSVPPIRTLIVRSSRDPESVLVIMADSATPSGSSLAQALDRCANAAGTNAPLKEEVACAAAAWQAYRDQRVITAWVQEQLQYLTPGRL